MAKTLFTIIGALVVTVVGLVFLRRDLSNTKQTSPFPLSTFSPAVTTKSLMIADKKFQVVLADTPEKREKGLSGTDQVPEQGMLFVFDEAGIHPFWMKEMKYDLDFIWIADDRVVEITANVPHPSIDTEPSTLPVYASSLPVTMMLEVPAGFAEQEGIAIGNTVTLEK